MIPAICFSFYVQQLFLARIRMHIIAEVQKLIQRFEFVIKVSIVSDRSTGLCHSSHDNMTCLISAFRQHL